MTKNGRKFLVKDISQDYHTEYGFVSKKELKKKNGTVKTNLGNEMRILEPCFIDLYKRIKRGPQIVLQKDIGLIIAMTGISKDSIVVDAGAGSGALCCFLANIAKKVVAYEIREDFIKNVKKNIELLGLKNIKIKNKDIYQGIDEKKVDVITLDVPEPWNALEAASKALKAGGFLVSYSPTIIQTAELAKNIRERNDFIFLKSAELLEREWKTEERIVRPESRMIAHTGFLSFARKV